MKIGDLLLLKGYINKKQLHSALRKQSEEAINYDRAVPLGKILIEMPQFNSSLDINNDNLIIKQYINIGIAVDTKDDIAKVEMYLKK